jgi:hypothetical protein
MIVKGNPGRGTPSSYDPPQTEEIGYALSPLCARSHKGDLIGKTRPRSGRCTSAAIGTGSSRERRSGAGRRMPVSAGGDEFLTVADIAGILKLNQQTVRN